MKIPEKPSNTNDCEKWMNQTDGILREMLDVAEIPVKPSYNPNEVCRLLGISYNTFRRMCMDCEVTADGVIKAGTLDSFRVRGERRVRFAELSRYLQENNSYTRETSFKGQLALF